MTEKGEITKENPKQEQIHNILFNKEVGWQEIIYDLINTEQLNPWDIDISILSNKYLEKIEEFEEQNYFISSKVLLAAALLLRIKSEVLLNKYMKSIDEIIFGKKEEVLRKIERIELDDEIPELFPKSPLPRHRKVTLRELVESLNKAIITENRRIKKEIVRKDMLREASIVLPRKRYVISDKINEIYKRILTHFLENKEDDRIPFKKISGNSKDDRIATFLSLLHLEQQNKIWLEQEIYLGEIHIWKRERYLEKNDPFAEIREEQEVEEIIEDAGRDDSEIEEIIGD
ncbi:hypothetical protein COU59_00430 [Candidatus Pacearchaeota archaeon CG10_big_fil_rev_8_21_14_0_10_34_12]|nr:MAG: hypothetical protein COU59_00430 [Candidatus Pacearchaeota archaeon CG10_big_fil_rev_8_21_14_0_10_34_12]